MALEFIKKNQIHYIISISLIDLCVFYCDLKIFFSTTEYRSFMVYSASLSVFNSWLSIVTLLLQDNVREVKCFQLLPNRNVQVSRSRLDLPLKLMGLVLRTVSFLQYSWKIIADWEKMTFPPIKIRENYFQCRFNSCVI